MHSLFESKCHAIVNPVNCYGIMGAGLAFLFKQQYPDNYEAYVKACKEGLIKPGLCHVFTRKVSPIEPHPEYIINFPTKRHWRDKSLIEDIDAGLGHLRLLADTYQFRHMSLPRIGCGLGGLKWCDVKPLVQQYFKGSKTQVIIYFGAQSKEYI